MSKQSKCSSKEDPQQIPAEILQKLAQIGANNEQILPSYETLLYINYHQTYFINQLLKNLQTQQTGKNNNMGQTQQGSSNSENNDIIKIQDDIEQPEQIDINKQSKEKIKTIEQVKNAKITFQKKNESMSYQQSQQYVPDDLLSDDEKQRRFCQTKNIAKNFGKAIISFILKEKALSRNIIGKYGFEEKEFFKKVNQYKHKVATIHGLRSFWLEQSNKFAKPVRILSQYFLRKYSLKHIFNSRVQNFNRNLKYKRSITQGLSDPANFRALKDD